MTDAIHDWKSNERSEMVTQRGKYEVALNFLLACCSLISLSQAYEVREKKRSRNCSHMCWRTPDSPLAGWIDILCQWHSCVLRLFNLPVQKKPFSGASGCFGWGAALQKSPLGQELTLSFGFLLVFRCFSLLFLTSLVLLCVFSNALWRVSVWILFDLGSFSGSWILDAALCSSAKENTALSGRFAHMCVCVSEGPRYWRWISGAHWTCQSSL